MRLSWKKVLSIPGLSSVTDVLGVTAMVMVESLQFLIILVLFFSFIPLPLADLMKDLPIQLQKELLPKRDIFFYRSFLIFAITAQAALVAWFRMRKMDIPHREFFKIAAVDGALVLIELFAVFKIWQYDNPWWARDLLYGSLGAWFLVRVFWGECQEGLKNLNEVVRDKRALLARGVEGLVAVLLIACLGVPDIQKVLARVFVWDQFHNWDSLFMLPGWAYLHGLGLNADIFSSWGMGAVIFISHFAQVLGGFDYAHVLTVLIVMVIIYYGALYVFLRAWLGSVLLAAAVVAVAVKIQMFHTGISPLIWIFPQDTPVRHWLDIPVLWCLWQHARTFEKKYLAAAALCIGAALAWVLSTGLSLLGAFWAYVFFLFLVAEYRSKIFSGFKDVRRILFYSLLPLVVMGLILFLLQGNAIFQASFWQNLGEPLRLFLQGTGTLSFYKCLYDRHFFAFIAGFVIPVIYAWTLIIVASLAYSKQSPQEDLVLIPLCVYGLCLYTHYLAHASISHYYAVGIPVVMVLGFWVSKMMMWFSSPQRQKILGFLVLAAWGALFTNVFFVYYPNIFDTARMDWKPEVNFYQSQFNFDLDAQMIDRLTPASQGAAVISSFESQILMQSIRKPFFYYAPIVTSERMDINGFAGTSIMTQERFGKTLSQITQQSPEYIFIERRLLGQWPAQYAQSYPGIILVLKYIVEHYQAVDQGKYLIAMHKK